MCKLPTSLRNWGSESFDQTLKSEIEGLKSGALPLDEGTTRGGYVDDSNLSVTVMHVTQAGGIIRAKVGVFFTEVVGGCSCGDDPIGENAYCEMLVSIDMNTADAAFTVLAG